MEHAMKKNRGFSLIELVVSIAILAIVGMVLVGFMSVASKTFRSINSDVNLQYESQLTVNQLKDLIVDSNRGIAYGLQPIVGAFTPVNYEIDNSETILLTTLESDPLNRGKVKRCLMIYNEAYDATSSPPYSYPVTKIVWDPDTKQLYYAQKTFDDITVLEADQYLTTLIFPDDYYLMSEYVDDFSVLMLDIEEKEVSLTLGFENSGKIYETTPSLALRNKVIVSTDIRTIYADTGVIRPSLISSVDIKKGSAIITSDDVKVKDTVNYTASVNAQFGANDAVQWVLAGNSTYGDGTATTLSQDGELVVSQYELATQISVTAMSVIDNSKKATVLITVQDGLGEFGYVNSLSLGSLIYGESATATAADGPYAYYGVEFQETDTYISYVNGNSSVEKGVNWDVTSDAPDGSYSWGYLLPGSSSFGLNGNCPVYVKAYYKSMGHDITITATSKGKDYWGNNKVVEKKFTVTGLQKPVEKIEPIISLDATVKNLSRNGKLVLTTNIQNVENLHSTVSIIPDGSEGFDENVTTKKMSNVYIENTSKDNTYNLFAKTKLDWNSEFSFKVQLHVTGNNNIGGVVDETKTVTITVDPVDVVITPASYNIRRINYEHYQNYFESIPTTINYLNLNVGDEGEINKGYYPEIKISNIIVYNIYEGKKYGRTINNYRIYYANSAITPDNSFVNFFYYYNYCGLTFKMYHNTIESNAIEKTISDFNLIN